MVRAVARTSYDLPAIRPGGKGRTGTHQEEDPTHDYTAQVKKTIANIFDLGQLALT